MRQFIVCLVSMAACSAERDIGPEPVTEIVWFDGDSGAINGVDFRLADVDAPETGPLKSRGGAQCENERARGFAAKKFMMDATSSASIRITQSIGADRYDREIIRIEVNGEDLAQLGVSAGHLAPWPHRGSKALKAKPDW